MWEFNFLGFGLWIIEAAKRTLILSYSFNLLISSSSNDLIFKVVDISSTLSSIVDFLHYKLIRGYLISSNTLSHIN